MLPNFTLAAIPEEIPPLHDKTLDAISKQTPSKHQDPFITVGRLPSAIGIDYSSHRIYVANSGDDTVSAINGINNSKIGDIKVGIYPHAIAVDSDTHTIYVAKLDNVSVINGTNFSMIGDILAEQPGGIDFDTINHVIYVVNTRNNTVSLINGTDYSNISVIEGLYAPERIRVNPFIDDGTGSNVYVTNDTYGDNSVLLYNSNPFDQYNNTEEAHIPVGLAPSDIGVRPNRIYVASLDDDSVSEISLSEMRKVKDIQVGDGPSSIDIDVERDRIYVANSQNNSISVINGTDYSKIMDIPVGAWPSALRVDYVTNTIYVANLLNGTLSVIDGNASKIVARAIFNIEPFNSGHIECDSNTAPTEQELYLYAGSQCKAKPIQGFEFTSWQENLNGNSTQLLQFSPPPSFWDSILDFFRMKSEKPEATLDITKFGNFTANFKALPPPIPSEYMLGLFTIVASTIVGWSIPSIISWTNSRRQAGIVFGYHKMVSSLGTIEEGDYTELERLNTAIGNDYSKRKISDKQYENMKHEIGSLYEEVYRRKIFSLTSLSDNKDLLDIRNEVSAAYRNGKISSGQYQNIKHEISVRYREIFEKKIDSLKQTSEIDHQELNKLIRDIDDAYAIGKLIELHYNLLKDRVSQV